MDNWEPDILKFPAPSEANESWSRPAASFVQAGNVTPNPSADQGATQSALFASQVFDTRAMAEPPSDTSPAGDSAKRDAGNKKGRSHKLEPIRKLNSVAATLIVAAGFAGLALWEVTRKTSNEAEALGERRSTGYPYSMLVSHRTTDTNPASGPGGTLDSGEESVLSLSPPSLVSPYPLEPGASNRFEFVPVPPPPSARFDEFDDIPVFGGSSVPSAGDDAELDVIEARVKSRLRREGKMPPEGPRPGSMEDYRQRIESGKNSLVKFVSGEGTLP